ncbi:hypothetical protein [Lonepinella koalarum]|nr:hypothetical protein [Lonepinella koalarum]
MEFIQVIYMAVLIGFLFKLGCDIGEIIGHFLKVRYVEWFRKGKTK